MKVIQLKNQENIKKNNFIIFLIYFEFILFKFFY